MLVETFGILEANRLMRHVCFHFTPLHASWLNMAEIEIGILPRQCLRRHIPAEQILCSELAAWQSFRNARSVMIHPLSSLSPLSLPPRLVPHINTLWALKPAQSGRNACQPRHAIVLVPHTPIVSVGECQIVMG